MDRPSTKPTVLVTGATGKTGSRLVPRLLERGATVRAAVRGTPQADSGVEPVHFDWSDEGTYAPALRGVDAIYLVTPLLSDNVIDPNTQVEAFLERIGAGRIVLLSSFGVDQAPETDVLRRTELIVEKSGLPKTILRPAAFMENFSERHWSGMAASIRERGEIVMPGGTGRVSYVSTHDIAAVAAVALTEDGHDGKGYTLTGPEALTLAEVAEHISRAANRPVHYRESGPETVHDHLVAAGASTAFADYVTQLYVGAVSGDAMSTVTNDVTEVTGRPATAFADYATDAAWAWR